MRVMPEMAKQAHAILIEGGDHEKRLARARELLYEHFADDPESKRRLDKEGVFSRLDEVLGAKLDIGEAFEDIAVLKRMKDEKDPKKDKKTIVVEQVDELLFLFKQKPFASTGRACLIPYGEQLATRKNEVQNKLLKLLEEPVPGNVIIILIQNAEMLLPTVRSRCVRMRLNLEIPVQDPISDDLRALGHALIYRRSSFAEATRILSQYEKSGEEAIEFLTEFQRLMRTLLVGRLAPELIGGEGDVQAGFRDSAAKVRQEDANRMRNGIALVETALTNIERGENKKYEMRRMALGMRTDSWD